MGIVAWAAAAEGLSEPPGLIMGVREVTGISAAVEEQQVVPARGRSSLSCLGEMLPPRGMVSAT